MKVPGMWKGLGWFLIVTSIIGIFTLLKLVTEIGMMYAAMFLGWLFWFSLISALFSIGVGVLLIKGSIWGYHLTKVLFVLAIINVLLVLFNYDTSSLVSILIRVSLYCNLLFSKQTDLYLSHLRYTASKITTY